MKQKQTKIGNLGRSVCAAGLVFLAACGEETTTEPNIIGSQGYRGMEELDQELTQLATACTFASGTGFATVVVASGETAVVSKRVVDNAILVNGTACSTATSVNLKKITITGSTGTDVVILDFINGSFGTGTSANVGFDIDLVSGSSDALKIRGSTAADGIYFGDTGAGINADTVKDISFANVDAITVSAGSGADVVSGNGGFGSGNAFASALIFYGGAGDDLLTGGSGGDTLSGDEGADTLTGGLGTDTLNGNAGNDTFAEGVSATGTDTFNGGADTDTVSYASRTAGVTATIAGGGVSGTTGASENDTIANDVETLTGGEGNDILTGDANANTLNGGAGNDTLAGAGGADVLNGGDGDDTFNEGSGAANGGDTFNGGAGTDTLDYSGRTGALTVTMDGVAANDGETGETDNCKSDVENIKGGSVADNITGNTSNNVITGKGGADVLSGGAGDDTFNEEGPGSNGGDTFNGGAGTDTVDYSNRTGAITVTMDGTAANDGESGENDDVKSDVENINGSTASVVNTITGNASANLIRGGAGADIFNGGDGDDTLFGAAGNDTLNGEAGDDLIDGGAGTNTIDGGTGSGDICINGSSPTNCEL